MVLFSRAYILTIATFLIFFGAIFYFTHAESRIDAEILAIQIVDSSDHSIVIDSRLKQRVEHLAHSKVSISLNDSQNIQGIVLDWKSLPDSSPEKETIQLRVKLNESGIRALNYQNPHEMIIFAKGERLINRIIKLLKRNFT